MTRRAFIQKYFWRFAVSLALLGLIVYTVYHVFGSTSGSLMKDYARKITDVQIVSGEAYLFREESVLTVDGAGVVNDLAESGKKVSKDTLLAEVWNGYSPEEIEAAQTELDRLNRVIRVLENSLVPSDATLSQAEGFRADALKSYLAIHRAIANGEWSGLWELEDEMLALLNRHATLTGNTDAVPRMLEEMKAARAALLRGSFSALRSTRSSGYYYDRGYVDGYEDIFTLSALEALTPQSFSELIGTAPKSNGGFAVGKMVYGNRWYLALRLDAAVGEYVAQGDSLSVTFPENRDRTLTMSCTRVIEGEAGELILVLASDEVPSDFLYQRVQNVEITVGELTGYYVPEAALRIENGLEGVYIFADGAVYFRRVEVLLYGDGYYVVAEQGERGDEYLALGDIIVISGENLYDGKVFK